MFVSALLGIFFGGIIRRLEFEAQQNRCAPRWRLNRRVLRETR